MDKVSTSVAEMYIDEDGILQIRFFRGVEVTLEKAIEYYAVSNDLLNNQKSLVLVDASEDYQITEEAKAYVQTEEAMKNRIAIAFVTNSIANQLMFNLYVKFYKPLVPLKMFSNKTAALKWLKTFYVMPGDKFELKKKKK
jgi:hypothetical protein